ncbi:MAG: hypothetical protein QM765_18095 [Myxococcales bacterium]
MEDEEPPSWLHGPVKTDPEIPVPEDLDAPQPGPTAPTVAEPVDSLADTLPSVSHPDVAAPPAAQREPETAVPARPPAHPSPVPRQRSNPLASPTAAAKMAEAGSSSSVLERYLALSDRDHYAFLGLEEDATQEAIAEALRKGEEELKSARDRAPDAIRPQLAALLGRLGRALTALGSLEARVSYDAKRGNYKGVARSLAAGLSLARLEKLHAEWAARYPEKLARAIELLAAASHTAQAGERQRAGELLEQALAVDPLNPGLQRRWMSFRARSRF